MANLKILNAIPIVLVTLTFVVVMVFNYLAGVGGNAIFPNSIGNISDMYYLDITPAGWTFSIWAFIYTWQAIWIVYSWATLFLNGFDGGKLYYCPAVIPPSAYWVYIGTSAVNIAWLIFWGNEWMVAALFAIVTIPATLDVSIALSALTLNRLSYDLVKHDLKVHVWLVRFLFQNGLGVYTAWVTIASHINLGVVLAYVGDMDQKDASTLCLSILLVVVVGWFILDVIILDKWTRYLFIPYAVIVYALAGVLDANYVSGERNSIFTLILEVVASLELVAKVIILIYRHITHPEGVVLNDALQMEKPASMIS